jgi:hypothetical protein
MSPELYKELDDFSLNYNLSNKEDYSCKKVERIVTKDSEWHEMHTVIVAGYKHNQTRLGFDGEKDGVMCEAKSSSRTIKRDALNKFLEGRLQNKKDLIKTCLDGSGVFSKFTHRAFKKYRDANTMMLVSGYINGVLMYVVEFPFNHPTFANMVRASLDKSLPGGDVRGLSKTISFSYTSYKDCPNINVCYLTREYNKRILKAVCTEPFYQFLIDNSVKKDTALPQESIQE